jgi:3-hydroxybutyryl-CoA dehydrogenase
MKRLVPLEARAVVVGAGTMGADIAVVLARAGCRCSVVEASADRRAELDPYLSGALEGLGCGQRRALLEVLPSLEEVDWQAIDLVIECIPERLEPKQRLFARLVELARSDALLCSNSSSFPISDIAGDLPGAQRMLGLHYFMPAHLVPLVEVVLGARSDPALGQSLCDFVRGCGMVPVLVRKDLPGFLANRLQHALAREAFALADAGVASLEDIDAAVRFGFGFRFLAAGPMLQRDHAGLDVHCAAAATMYPSLASNTVPSPALTARVAQGKLGMKTGEGFRSWTPQTIAAERSRYETLLRAGLELLADELPKIDNAGIENARSDNARSDHGGTDHARRAED